eukprot:1160545-Pelagomonas_calceolata.AAC.13
MSGVGGFRSVLWVKKIRVCFQLIGSQAQWKGSVPVIILGVSAEQDVRYINKEKKAMAAMKFPKELDKKVGVPAEKQAQMLTLH